MVRNARFAFDDDDNVERPHSTDRFGDANDPDCEPLPPTEEAPPNEPPDPNAETRSPRRRRGDDPRRRLAGADWLNDQPESSDTEE